MVEAIRDTSFDFLRDATSSSTSINRMLDANGSCSNVSGWDELVSSYSAKLDPGNKSDCPSTSRKRPNNEGNEESVEKIRILESQINASVFKSNQLTCPVCEHSVLSTCLRPEVTARKFVRHLRKHDGELDTTTKAPCTSCFNFHRKSKLDEHFKQEHSETERYEVRDVISFTNSTHKYQHLIDSLTSLLRSTHSSDDTCSRIPENSIFTGSTRMGLGKYRENCRQKFLSISDRGALFRFKYRQTSNLPFAWLCPLCEESDATSRCSSFHNDISLRLFVLRHLAVEHHNLEDIEATIQQEWAILSYEIGFDLEYHVIETAKLLRQTQRSNIFYTLRGIKPDHHDALVHEMIGRSMNKEEVWSSDYCVCIVCFKPVLKKSLGRHLSTAGHEWLNPHAELGEFREVVEVTKTLAMTVQNFPYATLFYSKLFRIKEPEDCDSITFLTWRCALTNSLAGHVDDILEFPTKELLKIHALKHFETYHQEFFTTDFFQYERSLLQQELPSTADVHSYSPLSWSFDNEPFDTTNPNHFNVPFRTKLLPKSCSDIQICGFCFWCGYSPQFLSHIVSHGYIDIGVALSDIPVTAFPVSLLSTDPETINSEYLLPNKILGSAGREALHRLKESKDPESGDSGTDHNKEKGDYSSSSSVDLEDKVHPVEIFVPRSECSSVGDVTGNDLSLSGCAENTPDGDVDFSNMTPKDELPLFNSLVVPKGEAALAGGSANIRITTPTPGSPLNPSSNNSTINEQEQELDSVQGPDNLDVQEHKLKIHRKFLWKGPPPPPLNAEQTKQLVSLARNECPFCTTARGPRGLRVPHFANDEIKEESMLAHVVKFHYNDPSAHWVMDAKRFHMSSEGRQTPLKFLLEPTKDGCLQCSSCEKASFDRIANLRVHWACCVAVCGRYRKELREGRFVLESPSMAGKLPKRRGKNEAIKCPLPNCVSAWRPSFKYPNAVTQIAHMISHHCSDKEAYETAVKLGETERIAEEFPFLDVAKSFANSVEGSDLLCLQCAKCDRGFHSPYELAQHAMRYHPTEKHYSGAPKCPFRCNKRLQRLKNTVTDNVLRLLHVMICHLPEPDAVTWVQNWMRNHESVMESEPVFKFNVQESLDASVESGECLIMCSFCSSPVEGQKYFAHRRRGSICYDRIGMISSKAHSLIENSKSKAGRIRNNSVPDLLNVKKSEKARKHNFMTCKLCSKHIIISEKYSERVSTFLHVLNIHISDQEAQKALVRGYSSTCAQEFPYIDVKASVEGTANAGKPTLQCVICGFKTDTSRRIAMHARHHEDLMKDLGNYSEPCQCGEKVRICSEVKESFQRLCHALEKHNAEEDRVKEAISSYEADHAPDAMILDRQRSTELTRSIGITYACSRCDFSSSNSYALVHHSKIHATGSNDESASKKELPRKTESPIVCTVCNRLLLRSSRYSIRVTILAHFVKFHRNSPKDVEKYIASGSWDVASEFPYIDAVTSIRRGKLQCAICEAAFSDTCPLLKHATSVHESYKPRSSNGGAVTCETGSSVLSKKTDEDDSSEHCSQTKTEIEKILASCVNSRPKGNCDEEGGETCKSSRGSSVADNCSRSSSRNSRRAPANDHLSRLPSDDQEDAVSDQEAGENALSTSVSAECTFNEVGTRHQQDDVEIKEDTKVLTTEGGADKIQNRNGNGEGSAMSEPNSSSTRKPSSTSDTVDQSSTTGNLLSWLSLSTGAVVPPRKAELYSPSGSDTKQDSLPDGSLRDALHGYLDPDGSVKPKPIKRVSKRETLFDELPQRMVKNIVKQNTVPPVDISHIEGAKGYPCNFCEFKGRTVNDIRRHTSSAHSEFFPSMSTKIMSPCHHCNEVLDTRGKLLKHIGDCHEDIQLAFKCAYCPKTFATARGVREHERRSHESRLFLDAEHLVCPHCEAEFQNKRNRDEHVKRHSNPNSVIGRGF